MSNPEMSQRLHRTHSLRGWRGWRREQLGSSGKFVSDSHRWECGFL